MVWSRCCVCSFSQGFTAVLEQVVLGSSLCEWCKMLDRRLRTVRIGVCSGHVCVPFCFVGGGTIHRLGVLRRVCSRMLRDCTRPFLNNVNKTFCLVLCCIRFYVILLYCTQYCVVCRLPCIILYLVHGGLSLGGVPCGALCLHRCVLVCLLFCSLLRELSLLVGSKHSSDVPRSLPSTANATGSKVSKSSTADSSHDSVVVLCLFAKLDLKDCCMSISVII